MGSHGTFKFDPDGIKLIMHLFSDTMTLDLTLDSSRFPYEFHGTEPVIATISLKDLNNALSSISKSSGVIFEKQLGKDVMNVVPTEAVSGIPLTSRSTIRFTPDKFSDIIDIPYSRSPSCYIKSNKFSQMFSNFSKNKVSRVECYMSPSGIKFAGNNNLATSSIEHVFGEFDEAYHHLEYMIALRTDVCKTLTKLGSLNSDGEVRVFYDPDNPHLFVVPVSTYGTLDIYIVDSRSEDAIEQEYEFSEAKESDE